MPEARIDHVARNVLHAAVVPIDRHPVFQRFHIREALVIRRIAVAQEIPRGARPLRHRISLTLCSAAALRAFAVDEGIELCQRGFAVCARLEILDRRQSQRQLLIRHRNDAALRAVYQRDRLAPVSLAVECPVLHLVLYALFAAAKLFKYLKSLVYGVLLVGESVELA